MERDGARPGGTPPRPEAPKVLALSLAVAVLVGLGAIWLPRLLGAAGGPEGELITQLKLAERDGLQLPIGSGMLSGHKVLYQRLSVTVDPSGLSATVSATLDFTGEFGPTQVSSLGVERIGFVLRDKEWRPATSLAPRLAAVVSALETRRVALETGNGALLQRLSGRIDGGVEPEAEVWLGLLERRLQVDAWFIRLERDVVTVSEQYRLDGVGRDRPFRQAGPRRLSLQESVGREFFFSKGVM